MPVYGGELRLNGKKSAHSVIHYAMRAQKCSGEKFYFYLYDCTPLHGGHPQLTGQKFVNSPFNFQALAF